MLLLPVALTLGAVQPVPAVPESAAAPVEPPSSVWLVQEAAEEWDFSYTYVELGAARFNVDDFDTEADIYYLEGSLGLFDFLYLFGSYQNQDFDIEDTDADLWTLGIGGHLDVTNRVNVLGELSYLFTDVSSSINELEDSNSGYRLYGGARWMALPWNRGGLEVAGGLGYLDLKDRPASDDSVFIWDLGLRAHFIKLLSVGAFYEMQGDDDQVSVNVRVSF